MNRLSPLHIAVLGLALTLPTSLFADDPAYCYQGPLPEAFRTAFGSTHCLARQSMPCLPDEPRAACRTRLRLDSNGFAPAEAVKGQLYAAVLANKSGNGMRLVFSVPGTETQSALVTNDTLFERDGSHRSFDGILPNPESNDAVVLNLLDMAGNGGHQTFLSFALREGRLIVSGVTTTSRGGGQQEENDFLRKADYDYWDDYLWARGSYRRVNRGCTTLPLLYFTNTTSWPDSPGANGNSTIRTGVDYANWRVASCPPPFDWCPRLACNIRKTYAQGANLREFMTHLTTMGDRAGCRDYFAAAAGNETATQNLFRDPGNSFPNAGVYGATNCRLD